MSKFPILLLMISLFLVSCESGEKQNYTIQRSAAPSEVSVKDVDINTLKTDEAKTKFLDKLMAADQNLRIQETEVGKKYGHNSKEHQEIWKRINAADAINLNKVRTYFDSFGFPDPKVVGEKGVRAMVMVIHHAPYKSDARREFLPTLYQGYKDKKLDKDLFDFFLGRMYDAEFGKRMKMETPFKADDRITAYLDALNFKQ